MLFLSRIEFTIVSGTNLFAAKTNEAGSPILPTVSKALTENAYRPFSRLE